MTFKGNTLVEIAPRPTDFGYQLYQRQVLLDANDAPMHTVKRFIAKKLVDNDVANAVAAK